MKLKMVLVILGLLAGWGAVGAAPGWAGRDPAEPVKLEEITVKGQGLNRNDLPTTVNVVGAEEFEERHGLRIEQVLNDVPGVWTNNYSQGGVANQIKMRGYGGGGHGGDVGVFVDGIPLNEGESHADGYADLNVLIPLEIDRLEVFKGPSSVLFGNFGRGGALAFYTRRGGQYNQMQADIGSFATMDLQGAHGIRLSDKVSNNTAYELFHTDGWRDHTDWSRFNASTRFNYDVSSLLDLSFSFRTHQSTWNGAGYIPKSQFDLGRDAASHLASGVQDDGGNKKFYTERLDAGYNISKEWRLLYWAYGTQQEFTRFQTSDFGSAASQKRYYYDRNVAGTGASLNLDTKLAGRTLTGVLGAEIYDEKTHALVWNTKDRVRTSTYQDRDFDIITNSLFAQTVYELSPYFRPMVGLRYDTFGGSLDNRDTGSASYNTDINDFNKVSPKVGFRSKIIDKLDFRASYSEGFALPSSAQKFDPKVQVDPVNLKQYETGLSYAISKKFTADLAYFILDSENEIQEDPVGSGTYRNVGKTRRQGLEAGAKVFPLPGLEIFGNLTLINSEVLENASSALKGKEITGVPDYTTELGAKYTHASGLGGNTVWRHIGNYYVDSANIYKDGAYDVVDAGIFYLFAGDGKRKYKLSFSVDNVFDKYYASNASFGYGIQYYAAGDPRTYWLGLSLDW
ncbi:MAG: TonB-dependent receptor [Pseudomonadota bacterium]